MAEPTAVAEKGLAAAHVNGTDPSLTADTAKLSLSAGNTPTPPPVNGADSDSDDGAPPGSGGGAGGGGGKKKKKKKKKSPTEKRAILASIRASQSSPPRIPLTKLFTNGIYPEGECHAYTDPGNSFRTTSEEKRHLETLAAQEDPSSPMNYQTIRRAAEAHRQIRSHIREHIKIGMPMTEIAEMIENGTRALVEADGYQRGIGFPTGLSLNHVAAHYSPNFGDTRVLCKGDVLKVDFGVQVSGRIVDSAFTLNFNDEYSELLEAVKAATNEGVKEAGIDARLSDIGASIEEVMSSYEVVLSAQPGNPIRVKPIRNLTGHNILPFRIHGGKSVPIIKDSGEEGKMEEGDYFAVETFGSTGRGQVADEGECSHYAKTGKKGLIHLESAKNLMEKINQSFGTLPFCKRYIDRLDEKPPDYYGALDLLVKRGFIQAYPPLVDVPGCMTAQFEHTLILRPTCKEIVSRGDDY